MKYLIPMDKSQVSIETLQKTLDKADESDKLIIIHCVSEKRIRREDMFISNTNYTDEVAEDTIQKAKQICEKHNIDYETEIIHSTSISQGIKNAEKKYTPDSISMGHRNTKPAEKSVTKTIMKDVETPLTIFTQNMLQDY